MTVTQIDPQKYVKKHTPRTEPTRNVSKWFLDEKIELDFGDSVGRPSENILLQKEYITRFLENGWTIDAVLSTSSDGEWQSVSSTEAFSDVVQNQYSGSSSSSSSSSSHTESGENSVTGGSAFWYAKQRVRLKRRRMQPEKVLQDMVTSFTNEYNSGRKIDDARFNEMVSLYGVLLKDNVTEGNAILNQAISHSNPTYFLDKLYNSIWSEFNSATWKVEEIYKGAQDDATADVNRQFDALLSQTKAQMITNGTYNSTVWPSVAAGIERQRTAALVKAKSEARKIGVDAITSLGSAKASAASALLAAQNAISDSLDKRRVTVVEMRNSVLKWMLDFMGTREEVYPELEEISAAAERLGFSVGAAGNVL